MFIGMRTTWRGQLLLIEIDGDNRSFAASPDLPGQRQSDSDFLLATEGMIVTYRAGASFTRAALISRSRDTRTTPTYLTLAESEKADETWKKRHTYKDKDIRKAAG
jgi:hypothetical protein